MTRGSPTPSGRHRTEVADYANEIEPSSAGGAKIARAVCDMVLNRYDGKADYAVSLTRVHDLEVMPHAPLASPGPLIVAFVSLTQIPAVWARPCSGG